MINRFVRVIIEDNDGCILAMAEHRNDKLIWNLPGGTVEKNEEPEKAAIREIREELNLRISKLAHLYDDDFDFNGVKWKGYFFKAVKYKNKPRINEPHKCAAYVYVQKSYIKNLEGYKDVLVTPVEKMSA